MSTPSIEHEPIVVLEAVGVPAKLADCRRLHPCGACAGDKLIGDKRCSQCGGTGVGPIRGLCLTYCESCSRSNRDFDPRLRLLPGDTPRPDPKPPVVLPADLVHEGRGDLRVMTCEEKQKEQRRINRAARLERKRLNAKAKAKKKAEKAMWPKWIPPWKQTPPS